MTDVQRVDGPRAATLDAVEALLHAGAYDRALKALQPLLRAEPVDWNAMYLAGQCYRGLKEYHRAIAHLRIAAACAPDVPPVFLALGIACQLAERLDDAREAFSRALTLDPDYTLAFNSLAMTQKLAGEYDKAAHNYDGGCMALARRLVKAMRNDRSSPIAKHRETRGQMWIKYALYGALRLVSTESGVSALVLPSGSMALREELDEYHAGLYWTDQPCKDGLLQRLMLPNFFNTFRDSLMRESSYSTLIGNRSTVLQLLGRPAEAALHLQEAHEFARKDA